MCIRDRTYTLHSEPGASVIHSGNPVALDENGNAEVTIHLTEAEPRQHQESTFYYVNGSSAFDIVVTDPAGNSFTRDFTVVFDPTAPSADLIEVTDQAGFNYDSVAITDPLNLTEGVMTAIIPVDIQDWCFRLSAVNSPHELVQCDTSHMIPQPRLQHDPGQATQIAQYLSLIHI